MTLGIINNINGLFGWRGPLTALGMAVGSLCACEERQAPQPVEPQPIQDTALVAGVPSLEPEPVARTQQRLRDMRFIDFNKHELVIGYGDEGRIYDLDPEDGKIRADLLLFGAGQRGQEWLIHPGLSERLRKSAALKRGVASAALKEASADQAAHADSFINSGVAFAREEIAGFTEQLLASQDMSLRPDHGGGVGGFNLSFKNTEGQQRKAHCTIVENRLRDGGKSVVLHQMVFTVKGIEILLDNKVDLDKVWPFLFELYAQGRSGLTPGLLP